MFKQQDSSAQPLITDSHLDRFAPLIIIAGAVIAIILLIIMYPGYKLQSQKIASANAFAEKDYAKAIPHYEWLVDWAGKNEKFNDLVSYETNLTTCLLETNQPQKALQNCEKLQSLAQKENISVDLPLLFGRAYAELGDQAKATPYFTEILVKNPTNPMVNFYQGKWAMQQERWLDAARFLQLASGDPEWDKRAEPLRQQLVKNVLGRDAIGYPMTPKSGDPTKTESTNVTS